MTTCPADCGTDSPDGLLCRTCTTRLERDLGDVPSIVADLDVAISKQARIGTGGKGGPARERNPVNWKAAGVLDDLTNTLGTWLRDVSGDRWSAASYPGEGARWAAYGLLRRIPDIRRHPAVAELVDEITDAIKQARREVDRPAEKVFVGPCYAEFEGVMCQEDVFARLGASEVTCKVCGITHDVAERRKWLLREADDQLMTIREAAQVLGSYGDMKISESTIRNYVSSGQLGYHGKVEGSSVIRLGDLLEVIAGHAAKPQVRKLKRAG